MASVLKFGRGVALPLIAAGALVVSAGATLAASTTVTGNAVAGKKLFEAKCAVCHKKDASGGVNLGDTTSADLQSPGLEKQYHMNDLLIKRAILKGKDEEGGDLDSVMPRWGKAGLKDSQANDIIAFLHTVKTKD